MVTQIGMETPNLNQRERIDKIREKIIDLFNIYPVLSKTMISSHIGFYGRYYSVDWNVVLDDMINEGIITKKAITRLDSNRAVVIFQLA